MIINESNHSINIKGEDALIVLGEIDFILIPLRNIARYYFNDSEGEGIDSHKLLSYYKETTKFIDNENITFRLAEIRKIITMRFNLSIGDDNMDDIERAMNKIKYWEHP